MRRFASGLALSIAAILSTGAVVWKGSDLVADPGSFQTSGGGLCVPMLVAVGQDVASAGGGAQNTTVASFAPTVSGLYIVSVSCSVTATDTVTIVVTYTDAVNATAQTVKLLDGTVIGANAVSGASLLIRANTSTSILVKYTISAEATSKASASIMRVN